jgi:DNA-binding SARP family transcriptional activator
MHFVQLGQFAEAANVVDEMRALARNPDSAPVVSLMASVSVVWYDALIGEPSYKRTAETALALAKSKGILHAAQFGVVCGALIGALSRDDLESADRFAKEFERELPTLGHGYQSFYYMFKLLEALLKRDAPRLGGYRTQLLRHAAEAGWQFHLAASRIVAARSFLFDGDAEIARAELEHARHIAEEMKSPYAHFMVCLGKADLHFNVQQPREGLEALHSAMTLGRAGGYVNTLAWQPEVMSHLCARALEAGIETEYVRRIIDLRQLPPPDLLIHTEAWPWPVKIYTLGRFDVLRGGEPIVFSKKVQRKPLDLLRALVAHGSHGVRETRLIDMLWPDASGDAGRFALTTTLHRLRRLLGEQSILRQDNALSLNERHCWVDVLAIRRLLERAERLHARTAGTWEELASLTTHIRELYRGPFLDDQEHGVAAGTRDTLRSRVVKLLTRVAAHHEESGARREAIELLEAASQVDPCSEDLCRRLMGGYATLGSWSDVQGVYRRCRDSLANRLDVLPSRETESLLQRLQRTRD